MPRFAVVARSDLIRTCVEDEIRAIYWQHFRAQPAPFPETLVALLSPSGSVDCAAGVRFGAEPFFSECYLGEVAEVVLGRRYGELIRRRQIIEVCNLAANASGRSPLFVAKIIEFADLAGADWAIFTATRPLRVLLERSGLALTDLAPARPTRVSTPSNWGTYYDYDPRVVAVDRKAALRLIRIRSAKSRAEVEADARVL
jgi:hypothetical protein